MKWIKEKWATVDRKIAVLTLALFVIVPTMIGTTLLYDGDNKKDIYALLRDIAAGCLVLIGSIALLRRAASQNRTAEAQHKTVAATLQSNQQTIFKDGLAFLGDKESESVRLGGIYNLHELAINNPERSKDVLEILCAHLRSRTNEEDYQEKYQTEPSVEISSLLELLTNKESKLREACKRDGSGGYILNFKGAFLNGADLRGAWLRDADLSYAQLQKSDLSRAQMQRAQLRKVLIQGAWLQEAKMQGADFFNAQMQEADLSNAQMHGADFPRAQMQGANLSNAQMPGAWLERAQMQGTDLQNAQLQGANLSSAVLHGANLEGARLQISQLYDAKLHGAVLEDVQLQGTELDGADLSGTSGFPLVKQLAPDMSSSVQDMSSYVVISGKDALPLGYLGRQWAQDFIDHMESRRGRGTELGKEVIFSGGLSQEDKENIEKALQQAEQYCIDSETLMWIEYRQKVLQGLDINTAPNYEIPEEIVITGILQEYEIRQIIEKYEKAMAWEQDDDEDD